MDFKKEIIETNDGSKTIYFPELNESYHSRHGAINEAYHVFIKNGFYKSLENTNSLNILEIGLGTGLNCFITLFETLKNEEIKVNYIALEKFPLDKNIIAELDYYKNIDSVNSKLFFNEIQNSKWENKVELSNKFNLIKREIDLEVFNDLEKYNLIYFDAFAPRVQPELWTENIFKKMYNSLSKNGILVTYCAKGEVRRNMIKVGFNVEKLEGPPGKREMLRAIK